MTTAKRARAVDLPAQPVRVNGDRGRLEQVMMNLLTNAINYAAGSERINLRARHLNGPAELNRGFHEDQFATGPT